MQLDNLKIIGTNHISRQSLNEARKIIESESPDIVAVELDRERLPAVLNPEKRKYSLKAIPKIGIKGFVFAVLAGWVEHYLGKKTGMLPGQEMAAAIRAAKSKNIHLALIDQPIQITLKRFSQTLSWKEKWNFVKDILKALFYGLTGKVPDDMPKFDVSKVPDSELIEKMLIQVKDRYPNIYNVLISERDKYMAKKLIFLIEKNPDKKIIAFVGAGHKKGIMKEIEKISGNTRLRFGFSVYLT